ncbi:MAG: hypothetical protein KAR12_02520 [Methylococcales bacterium]|nr:hypothetical protein [Methylococcales bacterium]
MINQFDPKIFIFIALDCEARPVVSFFDLKKENVNHPFSIYKHNNIILTVTGVGKVAMAGAVAYTLAIFPDSQIPVLINIGIAGHRSQAIGSLFMAIKVVDKDTGKKFYPQLTGNGFLETSEIKTTSAPCSEYSADCLIDMEASAFYEMAVRFTSSELIHSLKVVSDNESSSIDKIHPRLVSLWIAKQMTEIDQLLKHLVNLRESIAPIELKKYHELVKKWHFTVSGKIRLKTLLMRWKVLSDEEWLYSSEENFNNGKEVMLKLEADVNCLEVHL